ncbi:MAG: GNAT family N-acetyltransferase [Chitinophagaceae bacterium]|nr:GNAT family N-acetyltransferase [Chitinophagaceae bacterium]
MASQMNIISDQYRLELYTPEFDWDLAVEGLLQIFGDERVIRYNSNMLMKNEDAVIKYLSETDRGYENGIFYDYFLFDNSDNKVIGVIKYLSAKAVKQLYPTANYIFRGEEPGQSIRAIEYFLNPDYWRKGLMSHFLSESINKLFLEDTTTICAYIQPENIASSSILKKLFFLKVPDYLSDQGQELWYKKKQFKKQ